ncbi:MAG: PIN domain-containing protein [Burkholderiaceae bacterium]|nr:MAG: PIN domain-containing protein [Burkholderiaceae bacterium]
MPKRTYIDTCVLIAAFRGEPELAKRAMAVIDDPARKLVVSDAVQLEALPMACYHNNVEEVEFYKTVFDAAEKLTWNYAVLYKAFELAKTHGIAAMDAIHVAHAVEARVDEFVGGEKPTKPMYRVSAVPMHSIRVLE